MFYIKKSAEPDILAQGLRTIASQSSMFTESILGSVHNYSDAEELLASQLLSVIIQKSLRSNIISDNHREILSRAIGSLANMIMPDYHSGDIFSEEAALQVAISLMGYVEDNNIHGLCTKLINVAEELLVTD